jgi:hypothetical protein
LAARRNRKNPCFEEFGVHAQPQPDGQAYINVPFTADTMPAGSAQADMLRP